MSDPITETPAPIPIPDINPTGKQVAPFVDGVPVTLADGKVWLLARTGLARDLTELRDRLFDDLMISGEVKVGDVYDAACYCLRVNYDLTNDELAGLILNVAAEQLVEAVQEAILPIPETRGVTFTQWARAALLGAGIKPGDVPPKDLPLVLAMLQMTGKIAPMQHFDSAASFAAKKAEWAGMAKASAAKMLATD